MSEYGDLIQSTFGGARSAAKTATVADVDSSPDDAARTLELSRATGVSPAIIGGDLENFEKQHKAGLASELVGGNPQLTDYVNADPIHAKLSNDDWGQMDTVSEKMARMGKKSVFQTALDGFMRGFNAGYDVQGRDEERAKAFNHPLMGPLLTNPVTGPLITAFDTSMRTIQGGLFGIGEAVGEASTQITGNEAWGRRLTRDVVAGLQVMMPDAVHPAGLVDTLARAKEVQKLAAPYAEAGKTPPPGLHPVFDEIHKQQSEFDLKNLDEAFKEAQASLTRERNPDVFANFIRQHTDASIGISGEKVAELYGDKVPHPDDGILGFVPDMAQQLEEARATGGDVHVPLADWLAKADPEMAKELHDDIRVRPEGVTKNEAGELGIARQAMEEEGLPSIEERLAEAPKIPLDQLLKEGDMGQSPFLTKEGEIVATGGDHLSVANPKERREQGLIRFLYGDSLTDEGKSLGIDLVKGQEITPRQRQVLERLSHKVKFYGDISSDGGIRLSSHGNLNELVDAAKGDPVQSVIDSIRLSAFVDRAEQRDLRTLKLKKEGEPAKFPNDSIGHTFALVDEAGTDHGHLLLSEHDGGKRLYVDEIFTREGAQAFGPRVMRDLLQQVKKEFPEAETLEGVRVSGARDKAGVQGADMHTSIALENPTAIDLRALEAAVRGGTWRGHGSTGARVDYLIKPRKEYTQNEKAIRKAVNDEIEKLSLHNADVYEANRIEIGGVGVRGLHQEFAERQPLIMWSFESPDPVGTIRHESIHHLYRQGFFSNAEWETLTKTAAQENWIDKHNIARRYRGEKIAVQLEEAVADQFARWNRGEYKAPEGIEAIFQRIKELLDSIRKAINEILGRPGTWEDIFEKVEKGEVGSRFPNKPISASSFDPIGRRPAAQRGDQPELPGVTRMEDRAAFDKATAIGMTAKQYERYMEKIAERQKQDVEAATKRAMEEQRRRATKEWKSLENEERPKAADDINARPDVQAYHTFLETKSRIDPQFLTEEQKAGLPKEFVGKKDAVNPNDVASLFGYLTGEEMVAHMIGYEQQRKAANMRPEEYKRRLIAAETEKRVRDKYGDLDKNILEEAMDQVLSETQIDLLHEETLAAATRAKSEFSITKDQLKAGVRQMFEETRAKDVSSQSYLMAAGRAGRMANRFAIEDKPLDSFREAQKQELSFMLAKEALGLEKERKAFEKTAKRFQKRKIDSVEQEYTDFIHDLLIKAGQGVRRSVQDIAASMEHRGVTSLDSFVQSKAADGWELAVSDALRQGNVKNLDEMTVGEFRDFKDAIDSLAYVGRQVKKIEIEGEKRDYAEWKSGVIKNIKTLPRRSSSTQGFYWLDALLTRPEEIIKDLDLRKEMGPLYTALIQPFELSKSKSHKMMKDLTEKLKEIKHGGKEWQKSLKDPIPQNILWDPHDEVMFDLSREQMINIMLNFGNRSNIDKFTRSWATAREGRVATKEEAAHFEQQLRQMFDRYATKEDWNYVQSIWDLFKPWQKDADTLYRNTSGVAPKWIDPEPFENAHGSFAGGYFPIMYDQLRSNIGVTIDRKAGSEGLLSSNYFRASTGKGYTKDRTGYKDLVDFNSTIDTLGLRMQQMIHDISFRDWVLQAGKVAYDKDIRAAMRKYYGKEYEEQLVPWVKRVANNFNTDEIALSRLSGLMRRLRINMIGHALPFNYKVLLTPDVGAPNPAAITRFYTNYSENAKLAMTKSEEIPYLVYNMDRDFREQLEQTITKKGWGKFQAEATKQGYMPVVKLSQQFRMITFVDQYQKALARGLTDTQAISVADSFVRQRHGSAHIGDLPAIMASNEGMKIFTMFYGYFNTMYNWQREIPGDLRRGEYGKAMTALYGTMVVGSLFGALITPGKKDESWFQYIARVVGEQIAGTLPFVRDAVNLAAEGFEARTPISSMFKAWWNTFKDVKRWTVEKKPVEKGVKHATEAVGMTFGVPGTAQAGRTGQFAYDVYQGRQRPRNIMEWLRGIASGESKPKR